MVALAGLVPSGCTTGGASESSATSSRPPSDESQANDDVVCGGDGGVARPTGSPGDMPTTSGKTSNSRMSSIAWGDSSDPLAGVGEAAGAGADPTLGGAAAIDAAAGLFATRASAALAGIVLGPALGEAVGIAADVTGGGNGAARGGVGTRSGVSSSTGATATAIGVGGSALVELFELARRSTAIFCTMVRVCGLTIRSRTPSPTDFKSARIIATPTRSPCGARTGRKMPTRPSSIPVS
jgi:hypothetical protein